MRDGTMKWYHGRMYEDWSLGRKIMYVILRTCSNLWHSPLPIIILVLAVSSAFVLLMKKSDEANRKQHILPQDEAAIWVNSVNIKAENIFCTGTEEYKGNDADAQCVITTTDKKLITLRCANVWVERTGCSVEHLEK